jgi:hypothetical protein
MSHPPINKNVPMPVRWPFPNMQVGDSFAIPPDVLSTTVSVAATRFGKKNGMKFTVRKMPDKTFRCWRLT